MPPEQINGKRVDARADLYSLGCILYELITGRPPFLGASNESVVRKQLFEMPPFPSQLAPWIPPKLDELILALLTKDPRQRPGYAEDVARSLEAIIGRDPTPAPRPPARTYLYRSSLAGRTEELATLRQTLVQLRNGSGELWILTGESGSGKTRLATELGMEASVQGFKVLTGGCSEDSHQPLEALLRPLQTIADLCRDEGPERTARLLDGRGQILARYEASFRQLPGEEESPEPEVLPPKAARLRLFQTLSSTFERLAQRQPLLVILDDLQWIDELALEWLEEILRGGELTRKPLLIIGICRSEEAESVRRRLIDQAGAQHLQLSRLGEPEVAAIIGDMLALPSPSHDLSRAVAHHAEGNPLFVAEYLRAAVAEFFLQRDGRGHWRTTPEGPPNKNLGLEQLLLPSSLRSLIGRRLDGLTLAQRRVLELAAVFGRQVERAFLDEATRVQEDQLYETIAELCQRQIVEETDEGQLYFVHDKIREVTLENIEVPRRAELHRRASQAIERCCAGRLDAHLTALGRHWEQAGEPDRARPYYLASARRALKNDAHGEAKQLYNSYLELVTTPGPESIAARNELGHRVLLYRGELAEAATQHELALSDALSLGLRAAEGASRHGLGQIHKSLGDHEPAEQQYLLGLAAAEESTDEALKSQLLAALGALRQVQSRLAESREFFDQALNISRRIGDERQQGYLLSNLALLHQEQYQKKKAREMFGQTLELAQLSGHRRLEAVCRGNLGLMDQEQEDWDQARKNLEHALVIAQEIGERRQECTWLGNLAHVYRQQGELPQAEHCCQQALTLARQIGERRLEGWWHGNLALIKRDQWQMETFRDLMGQAIQIAREVGDRRFEARWLFTQALNLSRQTGNYQEAEKIGRQAEKLMLEIEDNYALGVLRCFWGHLELARGQNGRSYLKQAEELALKLEVGGRGLLGTGVENLRRAAEMFDTGQHHLLFRGELIDALPKHLRGWLMKTGQLANTAVEAALKRTAPTISQGASTTINR